MTSEKSEWSLSRKEKKKSCLRRRAQNGVRFPRQERNYGYRGDARIDSLHLSNQPTDGEGAPWTNPTLEALLQPLSRPEKDQGLKEHERILESAQIENSAGRPNPRKNLWGNGHRRKIIVPGFGPNGHKGCPSRKTLKEGGRLRPANKP
ncbi:putative ciliary rootlet coiled-coil protein-like [Sesbania bispinosa]|nr:putative ciliary rootlet coiled-coil protein-like [Sesbania bispinosa]